MAMGLVEQASVLPRAYAERELAWIAVSFTTDGSGDGTLTDDHGGLVSLASDTNNDEYTISGLGRFSRVLGYSVTCDITVTDTVDIEPTFSGPDGTLLLEASDDLENAKVSVLALVAL